MVDGGWWAVGGEWWVVGDEWQLTVRHTCASQLYLTPGALHMPLKPVPCTHPCPRTLKRHTQVRSDPAASIVPAATFRGVRAPTKQAKAASSAATTRAAVGLLKAKAQPSTAGQRGTTHHRAGQGSGEPWCSGS